MQKPLMLALAAVLGLVGWLSSQEQDDGVEVARSSLRHRSQPLF